MWSLFSREDRLEVCSSGEPELYHSLEGDRTCDVRGPCLPCQLFLQQAEEERKGGEMTRREIEFLVLQNTVNKNKLHLTIEYTFYINTPLQESGSSHCKLTLTHSPLRGQ